MSKSFSVNYYRYKCLNCGTPHRHRNKNKYPDLCEPCAKSQAQIDRHIAKANDKALKDLATNIRFSLAKISGKFESPQ